MALKRVYHKYGHKSRYNARETQIMVDYYNDLKEREFQVARGHYGDHRVMEDVVQRSSRSIFGKCMHLKQAEIQGDTKTARPHLKILAKVIKNVTDCGNLSRLKVCLGV